MTKMKDPRGGLFAPNSGTPVLHTDGSVTVHVLCVALLLEPLLD